MDHPTAAPPPADTTLTASPLAATHVPGRTVPDEPPEPGDPARYFTRQASELEYHARVLAGAADPDQPLLERVRSVRSSPR